MQFKDVIGQEETKKQLIQMFKQNRLSHALLFLGKEGSGALSLAMAFSQYINCDKVNGRNSNSSSASLFGEETISHEMDVDDSCGVCLSCQKSSKLVHPDIHYTYPVITHDKNPPISTDFIVEWRAFIESQPYGNNYDWLQFIKAENKQGNITARECEEIIRKITLKSFEAEYKFLIMWMPEMLGKEGNKLLKLIEEPPANTVFILVAENDQLILPTILSRTQLIKIPNPKKSEIAKALIQKKGLEPAVAEPIAAMCEGNYREALQQIEYAGDNWELTLRDWLNTIVKTGPAAQVKWVEDISKIGREKQKQFLRYFNNLLELGIRLRTMGELSLDSDLIDNENQQSINDFANRFNRLCDLSQQQAIINELDSAVYYIERNANAKILFLSLTIKLYHIISNKSVILIP